MRIDSHQHFWRYDPLAYDWIDPSMAALRRDYLPGDLAPLLAASGIDAAIAVQARQVVAETRFLLELARDHAWIRGVVGWVDLRADVPAQLAALPPGPLVGIRHVVQAEPDDRFVLQQGFQRGIAALTAAGLTYDLLIRPRQLPAAIELVASHPQQRFVLDHGAKPPIATGDLQPWGDLIRLLAQMPNVACKLSGLVTEADWRRWSTAQLRPYIDLLLAAFGPRRLLFGSDWPVCLLATHYARWHELLVEHLDGLEPAQQQACFGGNAERWYRLAPHGDRST